jgi:hypothetical protein
MILYHEELHKPKSSDGNAWESAEALNNIEQQVLCRQF